MAELLCSRNTGLPSLLTSITTTKTHTSDLPIIKQRNHDFSTNNTISLKSSISKL